MTRATSGTPSSPHPSTTTSKAWKQAVERGYDGYVAKDGASAYAAGATRRWLRVKQKAGLS